jgi:tetratricopeptide (TPR) repeat protein
MKKRATCALLVVLALILAAGAAHGGKKKKKGAQPKAAAEVEAPAEPQAEAKAEPQAEAKAEPGAAAEPKAEPSEQDLAQAKTKYIEGKQHYEAGKFDLALAAFTEAYNLSNKPDLLFNLGVCSEKLGQDRKAIAYYELYLEENPEASDRHEVAMRLDELKASQAGPAEPAAAPAPAPLPVEDELIIEEDEETTVFWPGLMVGLGGVLLASGAVTAGIAYNKYDKLDKSCAPDCADSKVDGVKRAALAADIQLVVGGAVAVAGVIWWLTSDTGESEVDAGGARLKGVPVVFGGGGGLVIEGGF